MAAEFAAEQLLAEIKSTREVIGQRDTALKGRVDEIERSVNELFAHASRSGSEGG
jgi:hypothetical protein